MSAEAFKYLDTPPPATASERPPQESSTQERDMEKTGDEKERARLANVVEGLNFATSSTPGSYEPKKLNATHREVIRLTALGYPPSKVAHILGVTSVMVQYTIKSPLGQEMLSSLQEARDDSVSAVQKRLRELSPLASERFADVLNDDKADPALQLRAAEKVLEMTGHKAANVNVNLSSHLTPDEIGEIKRKARKHKNVVSEADDAEYEEVQDAPQLESKDNDKNEEAPT